MRATSVMTHSAHLLCMGIFLLGCAQSDSIDSASSPILNGTEDPTDTAIVAIDTLLPTGEELCSGYLIMPDLVLTARHCVAPVVNPSGPCASAGSVTMASGGPPIDPSKLTVYSDTLLANANEGFAVAEVTVLPDSTGQSMCGNDLAVMRLEAPIDGITPLALVTAAPVVGEGFTAIGYGVSVPSDLSSSDRRRSRADLHVASVGASSRTVDGEWIADTGPCAGDSGSPAIDESGAAFGVMSRGPKATCTSMIYERVDAHADFLVDQVKASAERLGIDVPAWASADGVGGAGGAGGGAHASSSTTGGSTKPSPDTSGCSVGRAHRGSSDRGAGLALFVVLVALRRRALRTKRLLAPANRVAL